MIVRSPAGSSSVTARRVGCSRHATCIRTPAAGQLVGRRLADDVATERAEEIDLGAELREDSRDDTAAPGGPRKRTVRMDHLAWTREALHRHEVDPFDVPDDGDPRHRQGCHGTPSPRSFSKQTLAGEAT